MKQWYLYTVASIVFLANSLVTRFFLLQQLLTKINHLLHPHGIVGTLNVYIILLNLLYNT